MMAWIMNRQEVAPAFVMARAGYDVWLGNNRGNRFADTHTTLSSSQKEYWNFSWEEMGTHDLPAIFKTIQKKTGQKKISYIGHSEGTTQVMAGASLIPDFYKENVKVAVFLAPPGGMKYVKTDILQLLSNRANRLLVDKTLDKIKMWNLLPYNYLSTGVAQVACKLFKGKLCNLILKIFTDEDPKLNYTERYDVYASNSPSGACYRNFMHYAQLIDYSV
mmetsp:Transcript_15426/g.26087  ORF Transcript_15426/g.26087 Transcript_15426/m.26087 type:complete len:219 (+) Transcript_15426:342-998(+)